MVRKTAAAMKLLSTLEEPEQTLLAHVIFQTVLDAQQTKEPDLQTEARLWLWECMPHVAEGLELNRPIELS